MNTEEAFLQAIRESPDDDDLRLVFADWLEERDDPHGELMRVQVELSRLPHRSPRRTALLSRQKLFLSAYPARLLGPRHEGVSFWEVVRGLLHIEANAETFLGPLAGAPRPGWIAELNLHGVAAETLERLAT